LDEGEIRHRRPRLLVGLPQSQAHPFFSAAVMKRLAFAAFGALAGSVVAWLLLLAGSHLLSLTGIQLYASESGQQRNFNLFLLAWLVFAITGAWLGWRVVGLKASRFAGPQGEPK